MIYLSDCESNPLYYTDIQMREMRFRVWEEHDDPQYNHMVKDRISVWNIVLNHIQWRKDQQWWRQPRCNDVKVTRYIMQYTWLKDKNWREIYEGDIIDRWNAVVSFNNGRFQPVYNFWKEEEMEDEFHLFANDITVLGNIYESKVILE